MVFLCLHSMVSESLPRGFLFATNVCGYRPELIVLEADKALHSSGLAHLAMRVRIAYVLLGVTYVAVALSILLGYQPMERYWQIYPDPGSKLPSTC
jgi:hypothetical protein